MRSSLNPFFLNLYLDRIIILDDMVFFGTFCIADKSFFDCSLDRYHFCICYLFHYFYICCSVCCSLNDYILNFARVLYFLCKICLPFFLIFPFPSVCAMSSGVVDSSVTFLIFILSFWKFSFVPLMFFCQTSSILVSFVTESLTHFSLIFL